MINDKQKPWLIRTYAGHSSAEASNSLYKKILKKVKPDFRLHLIYPPKLVTTLIIFLQKVRLEKVGVPISHIETWNDYSETYLLKNEYINDN